MSAAEDPQWAADEVERVRARREQLRTAADHLASAIAAPVPEQLDTWWVRVRPAVEELARHFEHHKDETEGPGGLYEDLMEHAPRLANALQRLRGEHREIDAALATLTTMQGPTSPDDVATVREVVLEILSRLVRHRYEGADLLYQAYHVDIAAAD